MVFCKLCTVRKAFIMVTLLEIPFHSMLYQYKLPTKRTAWSSAVRPTKSASLPGHSEIPARDPRHFCHHAQLGVTLITPRYPWGSEYLGYANDSYHSPGCCTRCLQEGAGRRYTHACRLAEQDAKAFLGEMVIVRQDVREALAAHDVHGDTIREAVLLIETRFVER
jgi:hypothetical protein